MEFERKKQGSKMQTLLFAERRNKAESLFKSGTKVRVSHEKGQAVGESLLRLLANV